MSSEDDMRRELGSVIRRLRHDQGLTLVQLAARANLSHPFLSQLERGLARPSMASLHRIAQALGTTQPALMSQTTPAPAGGPVGLIRAGTGMPVENPGGEARVLVSGAHALYPMLFDGAPEEFGPWYTHAGEEFMYMITGSILVEVEGQGRFALAAGDTLYYPGGLAHRWRGNGPEPVRALFVQLDQTGGARDPHT